MKDGLAFILILCFSVLFTIAVFKLYETTTIEYNDKKREVYKQNIEVNTRNFYRTNLDSVYTN